MEIDALRPKKLEKKEDKGRMDGILPTRRTGGMEGAEAEAEERRSLHGFEEKAVAKDDVEGSKMGKKDAGAKVEQESVPVSALKGVLKFGVEKRGSSLSSLNLILPLYPLSSLARTVVDTFNLELDLSVTRYLILSLFRHLTRSD